MADNLRFIETNSLKDINIYVLETHKFKTNMINIFFVDNLERETVTNNTILPFVLKRGCEKYPNYIDISVRLEELYGASFNCGVVKKGEQHIMFYNSNSIADEYTSEKSGQFKKSFDFLNNLVFYPLLENLAFKNDYLETEKNNIRDIIEGRINDKFKYAVDRCFEEMCKGERFGIYENGYVEDIEKINTLNLYRHYLSSIENLKIYVFITGAVDEKMINYVVEKLSLIKRGKTKNIEKTLVKKDISTPKTVEEKMNINQGKLSIGFRNNTSCDEDDYYKMLVYNGILGGGVHSKLFRNVREKKSLAYYAFSRIEKFKGLMVISSGIDAKNVVEAQKIMQEQVEEIGYGNITDFEYDATIKSIENSLKLINDSQMQITDFYLNQILAGTNDTPYTLIEKIRNVSKKDVMDVSSKIKLDTIYFLSGN